MSDGRDDDRDDVPTPKESGSFQIATAATMALMQRLPRAIRELRTMAERRSSANVLFRDRVSAAACNFTADQLADMLEELRLLLPLLSDDRKRPALIPDLLELRRTCERVLSAMGDF